MPTFQYNALTSNGRAMEGTLEASSTDQAKELLAEMNLTVNEIAQAKKKPPKTHVGRSEFILFNQQLESITKAGIPLEKGLAELAKDVSSPAMSRLIKDVVHDLEQGLPIEKAIEKRQKSFPPLYSKILSAGAKTGRLAEMLTALNRHLELNTKTRQIIVESMIYPLTVFILLMLIMSLLFIFVIPTFGEVLNDMSDGRAGLPFLTQFYLDVSNNFDKVLIGSGMLVAAIVSIYLILSTTLAGRVFKERVFLKNPLIGKLYHANLLARLSESMALLVNANLPLPEVLRLSADTTASENLKLECETIASSIEQGNSIMEAGFQARMVPNLFLYSIQLGTQRNQLCDNLHSLGHMYATQTHSLQSRLQVMLAPAMVILLGLFVGTTVVAMFLPMISIVTVLM
jgi:type II secretory pathway component PulF